MKDLHCSIQSVSKYLKAALKRKTINVWGLGKQLKVITHAGTYFSIPLGFYIGQKIAS